MRALHASKDSCRVWMDAWVRIWRLCMVVTSHVITVVPCGVRRGPERPWIPVSDRVLSCVTGSTNRQLRYCSSKSKKAFSPPGSSSSCRRHVGLPIHQFHTFFTMCFYPFPSLGSNPLAAAGKRGTKAERAGEHGRKYVRRIRPGPRNHLQSEPTNMR